MWSRPFRTAFASLTSTPTRSPSPVQQPCKSSLPVPQNADTFTPFWQCTACGRRYVDPLPTTLFMNPPPTTSCTQNQRDETVTTINGGLMNLSLIAGGATCDYVRVHKALCDPNVSEQVADFDDGASAPDMSTANGLSTRAGNRAPLKPVGEHGRVSRRDRAVDAAYTKDWDGDGDGDSDDDCDFWQSECKDVDCIYAGEHCRHQCAMAEMDETPKPEGHAPKRALSLCGRGNRGPSI